MRAFGAMLRALTICFIAAGILTAAAYAADDAGKLIGQLKDNDPAKRAAAAQALSKFGGNAEAVNALVEALTDDNETVARKATLTLRGIYDFCESVLPNKPETFNGEAEKRIRDILLKNIKRKEPEIREGIMFILEGSKNKLFLTAFIEALGDDVYEVAILAENNITHFGDAAVEPLIKALNSSKSRRFRQRAAKALSNIGDERAVKPLLDMLKSDDADMRHIGAGTLRAFKSKEVIESLINALGDQNRDVAYLAAHSLKNIGEPALEPLLQALKSPDAKIRGRAADLIGDFGDISPVSGPDREFDVMDPEYRYPAATVDEQKEKDKKLKEILAQKNATDLLLPLLQDERRDVRVAAAEALGKFHCKKAKDAIKKAADAERNGCIEKCMLGVIAHLESLDADKKGEEKKDAPAEPKSEK